MFEPKYYHTSLPWCDLVVFLDRLLKVTQQSLSQRNTMIIHVEELVLVRPARSSTQFSANNTYPIIAQGLGQFCPPYFNGPARIPPQS